MTGAAAPGFVYLASQSPRRRALLAQIGVDHRLLLPRADEDAEALEAGIAGESPVDYVQRVTAAKLRAALARLAASGLPPAPVLCADTTVAIGRTILGKPADAADARRLLGLLGGRVHRVLTAVAVGTPGSAAGETTVDTALSVSRVRVAALSAAEIDAYVATGEPFGKAGSYAIQGRFAAWIERIDGSPSGIAGLPLHETWALLDRQRGVGRHREPGKGPGDDLSGGRT